MAHQLKFSFPFCAMGRNARTKFFKIHQVGNLMHESNQECKWIEVFVDGYAVAAVFGWWTVIAEFCESRIFDPKLDFVLLH